MIEREISPGFGCLTREGSGEVALPILTVAEEGGFGFVYGIVSE